MSTSHTGGQRTGPVGWKPGTQQEREKDGVGAGPETDAVPFPQQKALRVPTVPNVGGTTK